MSAVNAKLTQALFPLFAAALLATACNDSTAPSPGERAAGDLPAQSPTDTSATSAGDDQLPSGGNDTTSPTAEPVGPATSAPANITIAGPSERCYQAVTRSTSRLIPGAALAPSDFGFINLYTAGRYALVFKGVLTRESIATAPLAYWIFRPKRFAISGTGSLSGGGLTQATSSGNPVGQALGSTTVFYLFSTKTNVSYSLGLPWSASVSWENASRTQRIINTNWENTATLARSGVVTWQGGLTGNAGALSGLNGIGFRTGVAAGGDGPTYYANQATWSLKTEYMGTANATNPSFSGLYGPFDCSAVRWTN